MKKILLSTVVLVAFSLSIILFQISCKKDAVADTPGTSYSLPIATTSKLGGVKPDGTTITVDASGTISAVSNGSQTSANMVVYSKTGTGNKPEIWRVNLDGTQNQKINIALPTNIEFNIGDGGSFKLTKDASKLVFQARNTQTSKGELYSCNIDGSSVKMIVGNLDEFLQLGDVN